ncbi:MAG TPA: alpha/beta fold hydrolase [Acidimicrobiales bacterium]|nr:alpha/beta fold hydrolase [Acidimicrobiales bacterium]
MSGPARLVRVVAVAVALCLGAACTSSAQADKATTTVASMVAPSTTTTTIPLTPAGGTYGVGRSDVTLVDASRDTDADTENDVAAQQGRTLPTVILYPTADTTDDATTDADPVADGRFPLVVFSHGVTASGPAYVGVMKNVAAAGYVVALPTYPLTSGPQGWNNVGQATNQPADVSFIIDQLLEESAGEGNLLSGHLSPDAVAVAGHSLGAITSLLFVNSCCRDDRVKAIVAVSGITFPGPDKSDTYDDPPKIPLLMLHGETDSVLRYDVGSRQIFDTTLTSLPRALISFPDDGHVDILGAPSFMPSIVAFLDMTVRDQPDEWQVLGAQIEQNGDATIETAGGLTPPTD